MSQKLILNDDRSGYAQNFINERALSGEFVIETLQNCEPILEAAKVLSQIDPSKEFRHAGFIPDIFMDDILRLARERSRRDNGKVDGEQLREEIKSLCRAFLNNPEHAAFRTWPGKL